jgi:ferredoxin
MKIPFIALGTERKIGHGKEENISVLGSSISSCLISDFKMPEIHLDITKAPHAVNEWLRKNLIRNPKIISSKCTRCRKCEEICPVHTIHYLTTDKDKMYIDLSQCIHCFCCMEVCPHAAIISKSHGLTYLLDFMKKWIKT